MEYNTRQINKSMALVLLAPLAIVLTTLDRPLAAMENLDEMIARKDRYATNPWPTRELEHASNHYIWQPETLTYSDVTTGHEVWVLTHAPDKQEIYAAEHAIMAWSYNGAHIGFFSTQRPTKNLALGKYHDRWIVNTDGSGLRALEGYGRHGVPYDGFSWAHTEDAYYAFGFPSDLPGATRYKLYKNVLDKSNKVRGSLILDTSSINTTVKEMVVGGISTDDSHATFRDAYDGEARPLNTPNPIVTTEIYFSGLDSSPQITSHWGIARLLGPVGSPYGDHTTTSEKKFHAVYSAGPTGSWILGQYAGTSVFTLFKSKGSASDGGPQWSDWNGTSFGDNEIAVIGTNKGFRGTPYKIPYMGHPAFDRWGKFAIAGTYTSYPAPGTRIFDISTLSILPNYVFAKGKYDGQHHSWTGWTDYVLAVEPDWPEKSPTAYIITANRYNAEHTQAFQVVHTHYPGYSGNYAGYPRPSQSPDGTKVAFASTFLNNNGDDSPYIQWAVVYHPLPPVNVQTTASGGKVRLTWERPSYTTRGWPNEETDPAPKAREIKGFHVWSSNDGVTGWSEISPQLVLEEYFDINQTPNSTQFYAVTSEEYSRLESRSLSAIQRVSRDKAGNVSSSPFAPAGKAGFWTQAPAAPSPSIITKTTGSDYLLTWIEPKDKQVRYYNIYYSSNAEPPTDQQHRIASVPVGTTFFLDWLADKTRPGYYCITAVDRQGNESTPLNTETAPSPPNNLKVR
jgi:hypothetical protein